jgi:hypothetical protein
VLFGAIAIPVLDGTPWSVLTVAVLALSVGGMLPVAVALAGTGLSRPTMAFVGWFGPSRARLDRPADRRPSLALATPACSPAAATIPSVAGDVTPPAEDDAGSRDKAATNGPARGVDDAVGTGGATKETSHVIIHVMGRRPGDQR